MPTENRELSEKEIFDVLSSDRRRFVLSYLQETDGTATLNELARELGAREYESEPDELSDTQRRRLYVSLYQTHVPKMEDYEVVEYDSDSGVVETTERARTVNRYRRPGREDDGQWTLVYLGFSGLWLFVVAASVLDVGLVGSIDEQLLALAVVVTFGLLALVHRVLGRWNEGIELLAP